MKKELRQAKEKVADWNRLRFNIGSDVLDSKMKNRGPLIKAAIRARTRMILFWPFHALISSS